MWALIETFQFAAW